MLLANRKDALPGDPEQQSEVIHGQVSLGKSNQQGVNASDENKTKHSISCAYSLPLTVHLC